MDKFSLKHILKMLYTLASTKNRELFWALLLLNSLMGLFEMGVAGGISLLGIAMSSPETLISLPFLPQIMSAIPWFSDAPEALRMLCVIMTVIFIATVTKNALLAYVTWLQNRFSQGVAWSAGIAMFRSFLAAPYLWHMQKNSADLMTLLTWRRNMSDFCTALQSVLTQIVITVFLLGAAFIASPSLSALLFCTISGIALIIQRYARGKVYNLSCRLRQYDLGVTRVSLQGLQGIREITIYDRKAPFYKEFTHYAPLYTRIFSLRELFPPLPQWVLESAGMGLLLGVLGLLVWRGADVAEATGTLTLLAAVSWRLLPAANKTVGALTSMRGNQPVVESVLQALAELPAQPTLEERPLRTFSREIALDTISFTYPDAGRSALTDISLTLPKGKMIGFVGLSGSGKTTLSAIITGLLTPTSGRLLVDGKTWNPAQERLSIGYVPQNLYLLDATLAENVAFSRWGEPVDVERVQECCRMAAIEFVDDLPDGLNTRLGERGVRLSGGQIQRVGIARALYERPELLLFDEATSALDGATENEIQATITGLRDSVTLLIIAHRLSTVKDCDLIYWIEDGRIRASGKPELVLAEYEKIMKKL